MPRGVREFNIGGGGVNATSVLALDNVKTSVVESVPEPATMLLVLAGAGFIARKRRA